MSRSFALLFILMICASSNGEELSVFPTLDATLYESADGGVANGAGQFLFVGRTGQETEFRRRTLLSFDLQDIPLDATILTAELSLTVDKASSNEPGVDFGLHRMTSDWTAGESDASGGEGSGAEAVEGDSTWLHSSFPDEFWTNPGADFLATATDSIGIAGVGQYTWGQGGSLLDDVQAWIQNPDENFGWAIIGGEETRQSAKRFVAGSSVDVELRPVLRLSYKPLSVCNYPSHDGGDFTGDGIIGFDDFLILSSNFGKVVSSSLDGDINCNCEVDFADFLILSGNFGKTVGGASTVPEPTFRGWLICIGLATIARTRKPRN